VTNIGAGPDKRKRMPTLKVLRGGERTRAVQGQGAKAEIQAAEDGSHNTLPPAPAQRNRYNPRQREDGGGIKTDKTSPNR